MSAEASLANADERMAERHLGAEDASYLSSRAGLKRFLSLLRDAGMIAPPVQPPITPHEQIFKAFGDYLPRERGLAEDHLHPSARDPPLSG
jgi:hypothetical protein